MYSIEIQTKIVVWRAKAAEGTLSDDEMRQAIVIMREGRISASIASETSRAKKVKNVVPNADDLMSELEGL